MREPPLVVDGLRAYTADGEFITLTGRESLLLQALLATWPRVSNYDYLIEFIWDGEEPEWAKNTLKVFKCSLAAKLKKLPVDILVDYGLGYRLVVTDPPKPDMEILRLLS